MAGIACQLQRNAKLIKNILKTAKMREQNVALRKIKGKNNKLAKRNGQNVRTECKLAKKFSRKTKGNCDEFQ